MLQAVSWQYLAFATLFLLFEGVFTALRIWLFAGRKPCLSDALKANAWYVLLLIMLPARLGEVAAVIVFEKQLGQKRGAAAMSIVSQRLYDVVVLGSFFLIALMGLSGVLDKNILALIAVGFMGIALFVLYRIDFLLTMFAGLIKQSGHYRTGLMRKIMRFLLQARTWNRNIFTHKEIAGAIVITIFKWISNLGALILLIMAVGLGLPFFENLTVSAAYNFLAIIPLQTIGGLGIGEAGLTLLLIAMGLTASKAASASLMVRLVIVLFPFLFWVCVMGGLKFKQVLIK